MNRDGLSRLLGDVLNRQIENGKHGSISSKRMTEALTTGPELTQPEKRTLLLSPHCRRLYNDLSRDINQDLRNALADHHVDTTAMLLAASDSSDKVVLQGQGFSVTVYRTPVADNPLVLLVQLNNVYREAIHPMTNLRLMDTGGLEWLRGKPDLNGQLTGLWSDKDIDLVERVRKHKLILEPV